MRRTVAWGTGLPDAISARNRAGGCAGFSAGVGDDRGICQGLANPTFFCQGLAKGIDSLAGGRYFCGVNNTPEQIVARIKEMREILELSPAAVAEKLGIEEGAYLAYESGEVSIPINALYAIAEFFKVDVTVLLTGEVPRMADYTVVRAGHGAKVDRFPGYEFESLAANYSRRDMEPMLVRLAPHEDEDHEPAMVSHHGQEFNYVLQGSMKVIVGRHSFVLNPGDSIYFNAAIQHAQRAVAGPALFLTVIQN